MASTGAVWHHEKQQNIGAFPRSGYWKPQAGPLCGQAAMEALHRAPSGKAVPAAVNAVIPVEPSAQPR